MNKPLALLMAVAAALLIACGGKSKKAMSGEEKVELSDFIEFFNEIKLPVGYTDTILRKKASDSLLISHKIFNQFIGDSIFQAMYGKEQPKIYAIGRFRNKEQEHYLLFRTKGKKNCLYVAAISPEGKYSANMVLLSDSRQANAINRVVLDSKFSFTLTDSYKNTDGSTSEYNTVYAYNNAGLFMVILKDGLKQGEEMPIINPIDTLPATHKFSGDYGRDKRNFISIRDGKSTKDFVFFLNFDKGKENDCRGELKGDAVFVSSDSAVFKSGGDPCAIGFKFGSNRISIKEIEGCGSHRPLECSLNASYTKLKAKKPAADKKTKKKK